MTPTEFGDTTLTKVFVGGLAWETPVDRLKDYFDKFGDILEAVIISDKFSGRSKGYGFVTFKEPEAAKKACEDPTPIINEGELEWGNVLSPTNVQRGNSACSAGPRSQHVDDAYVSSASLLSPSRASPSDHKQWAVRPTISLSAQLLLAAHYESIQSPIDLKVDNPKEKDMLKKIGVDVGNN
ncbi:hypothetical protein V2J09_001300 [Rumex salicifolius]